MSTAAPGRVSPDRYWMAALARAVVALVAGGVITFDPEHSARVGMLVFGAYALIEGVVVGASGALVRDSLTRWLFVAQGAFGVLVGVAALTLNGSGLGVLLGGVTFWAALTGAAEAYCGFRARGRLGLARDWMTVGGLTLILMIVYLLIPPDSVLAVGLFGAYAVVVGVYVAIGAFTLKFGLVHGHADENASERHA